jgi:hypothetical protein
LPGQVFDEIGGFCPTDHSVCLLSDCDVPGQVLDDAMDHSGQTPDSLTIKTTPDQDRAMQNAINQRFHNPGKYNLYNRNCARFVEDVLHAGDVSAPDDVRPDHLFRALQDSYSDPYGLNSLIQGMQQFYGGNAMSALTIVH